MRPIPKLMSISSLHEEILDSISESTEQKSNDSKEINEKSEKNSDTEKSISEVRTRTKESQEKSKT